MRCRCTYYGCKQVGTVDEAHARFGPRRGRNRRSTQSALDAQQLQRKVNFFSTLGAALIAQCVWIQFCGGHDRGDYGISKKQAVDIEPFYGRSDEWMMVSCISRKYPTRMARYASDTLEFYRPTVLDGLDMVCLVPTIPTGRSRLKGCLLVVKNTDFGQTIIRMGKWLQEGTTRTAKKWAIGSFGVVMARRKKARTSPIRKKCADEISY